MEKVTSLKVVTKCNSCGSSDGFTMVELLVVMLVILILLAIAIPTYLGITNNARNTIPATDLAEAIIAATAVYSQDAGAFVSLDTNTGLSQLQSVEPGVEFTSTALSTGMPNYQNIQYEIQVDACNASGSSECQWVAMSAFSDAVGTCYYVLINKGMTPATGLNWSNPTSSPPIAVGSIPSGTWYATIGPTSKNFAKKMTSCDVFTDTPKNVQEDSFPAS